MPKPRNFPAFPVVPYAGDEQTPQRSGNTGMSAFHVFAAAALPGVICSLDENSTHEEIASEACNIAEATMAECATRLRK